MSTASQEHYHYDTINCRGLASHYIYDFTGMYGPGGMGPGPRGMMIPRPGVPVMGMGRGGFPPMAGPPMDMYYYNPYMGEGMGFYGKSSIWL